MYQKIINSSVSPDIDIEGSMTCIMQTNTISYCRSYKIASSNPTNTTVWTEGVFYSTKSAMMAIAETAFDT